MLAFMLLLLIPIILMFLYVWYVQANGGHWKPLILILLACFVFLLSYLSFLQVAKALSSRFRTMIERIGALMAGSRLELQGKMDVTGLDEFGQLGQAFNELQAYTSGKYATIEHELRMAYRIQQSLLPQREHHIGNCRISAICRQTKEVGGDFYDIVQLDHGFAIIVGDVVGKGLQAALLMSATMTLFRREIRQGGSASEVLERLNLQLFQALSGKMFVTAGLAIIENESTLSYANAGHMPPYLLHNGKLEEFIHPSMPLGVDSTTVYASYAIDCPQDSRFIMYTDGMVESFDRDGTMLGFEGFERHLLSLTDVNEMMERLTQTIDRNVEDDRTLVVIERIIL